MAHQSEGQDARNQQQAGGFTAQRYLVGDHPACTEWHAAADETARLREYVHTALVEKSKAFSSTAYNK